MKQSVSERIQLARNPSTPVDVLRQLAADEYGYVRWHVAHNLSTPEDILAQLATDTDRDVRSWVADNPSTPTGALAQLATDTDSWIRWRVALHPSLPLDSDTFQDLMVDPDPDVRAVTMKRLANHLTSVRSEHRPTTCCTTTENHKSKL